jgi:hypothetical protein
MKSSEEIKKAINEVAKLLGTEEFNIMVTKTQFPTSGKPMSAWSVTNKLMCILAYSKINNVSLNQAIIDIQKMDFRGNKQWEKIERKVTDKQKSATILIPIRFNYYKKGEKTISAKEYEKLENKEDWRNINYKGFKGLDVYEKQQTDGKPVEYPKLNLPKYDYEEVAKFLGLKIIAEHGGSSYNGYYSQQAKAIVLATPEEGTFYHELAHAVDDYLLKQKGKELVGGQDVDQEVIAQTTSGILAYINGQRIKENLGYTRKYVEGYAGKDFEKTILKVMGRIERILTFILNFKDKTSGVQQAEKQNKQPLDKTTKIANNPPKPTEKEKLKNKLKSKGLTMGIEPTTKKEDEIIEKDLQEQKPKEDEFYKREYKRNIDGRIIYYDKEQGWTFKDTGKRVEIKESQDAQLIRKPKNKRVVSEETRAKLKARIPTPKQLEARKKFAELMKKKKQEKQEREGKK